MKQDYDYERQVMAKIHMTLIRYIRLSNKIQVYLDSFTTLQLLY